MQNKTVGELLTEQMQAAGITQSILGRDTGVSTAMISSVCTGKSALPVSLAARIGEILGVDFGEMLLKRQHETALNKALELYGKLTKGQRA